MDVEVVGGVTVVAVSGRLDALTSEDFVARLSALLDGGVSKLLLDLAAVTYLSSMGIRALVTTARRLHEGGGRMAICGSRSPVREVLQLTGFEHVAPSYATREEGVASFR